MDNRLLNVIDEDGNVVRIATRQEIHEKGLLHPEVHVWFYTPDGKLIFQHRAKDKDTWPDLLDATVGGHVEIGDSYEDTALKEAREETGIEMEPEKLTYLRTTITNSPDETTGLINHPRRNVYAYRYEGDPAVLRVEEGKALGFESYPIHDLLTFTPEQQARFIPTIFDDLGIEILKQIQSLI